MVNYPNCYPKIVLFGDSLTEYSFNKDGNWGGKLQELFKRKADIVNRGFSGYNTELLKLVGPKIFNRDYLKDVACLTLCIGANDSWDKTNKKFDPFVTVNKYKQNLVDIIKLLNENGLTNDKILLITPPTIVTKDWYNYCVESNEELLTKTPEQTKRYVDAMVEVGKSLDIKVLDAFEITSREDNIDKAFCDGLHFSEYGANLIFDLIKNDIEKLVEKFRNSSIENFPTYNDIDYNNLDTFYN